MAATALTGSLGLFGDEVFSSTDLNRRGGEVLNHARKSPVTVSRNGEQFAILRREVAAELIRAASQFGPILELVEGALNVAEGKTPPTALAWLGAFEVSDLRKLIREVLEASFLALRETANWEVVNSVIHEWHESALVATSGVLDEALKTPSEKLPLQDPRMVTEACNNSNVSASVE